MLILAGITNFFTNLFNGTLIEMFASIFMINWY